MDTLSLALSKELWIALYHIKRDFHRCHLSLDQKTRNAYNKILVVTGFQIVAIPGYMAMRSGACFPNHPPTLRKRSELCEQQYPLVPQRDPQRHAHRPGLFCRGLYPGHRRQERRLYPPPGPGGQRVEQRLRRGVRRLRPDLRRGGLSGGGSDDIDCQRPLSADVMFPQSEAGAGYPPGPPPAGRLRCHR